jgi:hypothetical protein
LLWRPLTLRQAQGERLKPDHGELVEPCDLRAFAVSDGFVTVFLEKATKTKFSGRASFLLIFAAESLKMVMKK